MRGGRRGRRKKQRSDRSEAESGEMTRGNSLSQAEVAAPGLLLYEDEALCDEAESCSDCQHNGNLLGIHH